MKTLGYSGGLIALALAVGGCSSLFEASNGDADDGERDSEAAQLHEQIRTYLQIEGAYSVVQRNGVEVVEPMLKVTNTGTVPIRATTGPFPWWLRAYTSPDRTGTPVWRSEDVVSGGPDIALPFEIAAGGTLVVGLESFLPIPVSSLVGNRVSGSYYFAVRLELFEPAVRTDEMSAGEVTLPEPQR